MFSFLDHNSVAERFLCIADFAAKMSVLNATTGREGVLAWRVTRESTTRPTLASTSRCRRSSQSQSYLEFF